jgi:Fur family ferric uptake transcriptional regulator
MSEREKSEAEAWLRQKQLRVTQNRLSLVAALLAAKAPLTLAQLQEQAQHGDFATVFRFIGLLEKKHWIKRHAWGDRHLRYELQEEDGHDHHHHLICRVCGKVRIIAHCLIEQMQAKLERESAYRELSHSLEFFGVCPACQKKSKRRRSEKPAS